MITRVCESCKKPYETFPSIRLRYCSMACVGDARRLAKDVNCAYCGKTFRRPPSMQQVYCSKTCAITARNLTDANPSYHRDITGERNPMYGRGMKGSANPMFGKHNLHWWKGGRKVRKDGYCFVWIDGSYVLEHRYVVEQRLGRKLQPEEVVHHIDGDPSNNTANNLELLANQAEHMKHHRQH